MLHKTGKSKEQGVSKKLRTHLLLEEICTAKKPDAAHKGCIPPPIFMQGAAFCSQQPSAHATAGFV